MEHDINDLPLPVADRADGAPRRLGIELEFAGLTEADVARIIADQSGGYAEHDKKGDRWTIDTPLFGICEAYLDTRFHDDIRARAGDLALDLARLVVPVELVTDPFDPHHLDRFDSVVDRLRAAGAKGSREGLFLGFGVHLNIEIADDDPVYLWRVLTAYALLEGHLRTTTGIDISRRILPFVSPYPEVLVDDLAKERPDDVNALIDTYMTHAPTRDQGLDMLPIFAHLAPDHALDRIKGGTATKPRPAFHFRLPDCRIDEPGWSIFTPWTTWLAVERLAAAPALLDRLRTAWFDWRDASALTRGAWSDKVAGLLGPARSERAQSESACAGGAQ